MTGEPAAVPGLEKVLQAMGLSGKKPVLHAEHPVVVGLSEEQLLLCPPDTHRKSSVLQKESDVNTNFANMLGKSSFQFDDLACILYLPNCRLYSSTRSNQIPKSA